MLLLAVTAAQYESGGKGLQLTPGRDLGNTPRRPNPHTHTPYLHRDPGNASLTFLDGTPDYMHMPSAACRIASAFPAAKIIVLLRDPVSLHRSSQIRWVVINLARSGG